MSPIKLVRVPIPTPDFAGVSGGYGEGGEAAMGARTISWKPPRKTD